MTPKKFCTTKFNGASKRNEEKWRREMGEMGSMGEMGERNGVRSLLIKSRTPIVVPLSAGHYGTSKIMEEAKMQKFDKRYNQFLFGKDAELHCKAVKGILSLVGLAKMYNHTIKDRDALPNFFLTWKVAAKEEEDPNERKGLENLGKLSEEYFNKKDYRVLSKLFADIVLRHLVGFLHLEEREDFEKITEEDLYEKKLIPGEIYLQFFLIETMSKAKDFDWSRNEDVVNQNLACLIVCFSDIYDFFNNSDESKI